MHTFHPLDDFGGFGKTEEREAQPFPSAARYKDAKACARWMHLVLGTSALPFDPFVALAQEHVNILSYTEFANACGMPRDVAAAVAQSNLGGLMMRHGKKCFLYNERFKPWDCVRWTAAHELAHDGLGHLRDHTTGQIVCATKEEKAALESEADACAEELLVPKCIMVKLGIKDAGDIRRVCRVSHQASEINARYLQGIRGPYYMDAYETRLCIQFRDFLEHFAA